MRCACRLLWHSYKKIPRKTTAVQVLDLCIYVFMNTCVIVAHVTRALGYRRVFGYLRTHTQFAFARIHNFPLTPIWNFRLV